MQINYELGKIINLLNVENVKLSRKTHIPGIQPIAVQLEIRANASIPCP